MRCLNEDKEQILTDHEGVVLHLHYMDKSMLTGSLVRLLECIYIEIHHVLILGANFVHFFLLEQKHW